MKAAIKGPMTLVTRTEAGQLSLEAVPASHRGPVIIIVTGIAIFRKHGVFRRRTAQR